MQTANCKIKRPTNTGFRKLRRHKLAMISFYVLVFLYASAIFAGFIAPYHFDNENRVLSYAPATKIYFFNEGKISRPFVYLTSYRFDEFYNRVYRQDKSKKYFLKFFMRGDDYRIFGLFKTNVHLFGVEGEARIYLLGADSRGRDLFSRIFYGGQVSLSIGLVGVLISLIIGVFIGGISGYFSGRIDNIIMRACEIIMAIPGFYLMLALRSIFSYSLTSVQIYFLIVLIMSFIGWPGIARVVRGMALSLREREFVLAAKALGVPDAKIILRHIIPHTFSYVIVAATLSIPGYILGESALSLLGLGIQDPYASWGNLLSESMAIAQIKFHPWILIPGVFIFITVMAFNLLGDGLRDVSDPKMPK
ncbi:MAG: ABC transporter permease [Candidatus Omnitrophica bacterium]|nr:ABC transporter permease [Candidatus Omnitrophota bacterium]MBU0878722.1 ABC transporter permease [Candidatus Omnitrophota bacterium]MBU1134148.1 ABC transporter permease [Candidatus Omnitrophota bacterium]MBU1809991.1 ABC transporter permease [Candidatus Omnitrophota bacterium]